MQRQHFGGGLSEAARAVTSHLTARDREAEIIAASKQRREEERQRKEHQYRTTKQLDSEFSHFMSLMTGNITTNIEADKVCHMTGIIITNNDADKVHHMTGSIITINKAVRVHQMTGSIINKRHTGYIT